MILWNSVSCPYLLNRYSDSLTFIHPLSEAARTFSAPSVCTGTIASEILMTDALSGVSDAERTTAPPPKTSERGRTIDTTLDRAAFSFECTNIQRAMNAKQNAITIRYSIPFTNVIYSSNVFIFFLHFIFSVQLIIWFCSP